jgi:hypothetical protein
MNERKIILPDQDGVSNLEIRRMQSELEEKPAEREMLGYMPVELIKTVVGELTEVIESVERGEVSTICLLAIMPQNPSLDAGKCFMSVADDELGKLDELFHMSLANRPGMQEPPDEAG